MAAPDPVMLHNKAQFMSSLFEAMSTAKQMPTSLRNHMNYGRAVAKHFLKPPFRLQRIAGQKLALGKDFEAAAFASAAETLKQAAEVKVSAGLTAAMGKVDEAIKASKQPSLPELVDVMIELAKVMQVPQPVLQPTLDSLVKSGVLDQAEVSEVAVKVSANPFTPDQVWEAVADRMDATKDGRAASYRKQGKSAPVQREVTKAGHYQIVDTPKDKQFATMPINTQMAGHMACGAAGRANFTHLDAVGHPAARGLIEDLTNILLVGTNVAEGGDMEKSVAMTLKSMDQGPMNISFRTIIDKSTAQPMPSAKVAAGGPSAKAAAPSAKAPGPGPSGKAPSPVAGAGSPTGGAAGGGGGGGGAPGADTNFMEVFEKLKQMGQGVTVPIEMLDAVFAQLVQGNVATAEEVDKAKTELKTKADDKGQVSFPVIQEVFMGVFGSKLAK